MASPDSLRREGDYWSLLYEGETVRLRDAKGLRYLAVLLAHPGREFHVLDLVGGAPTASAVPTLDPEAKAAYAARVRALDAEIAEAEGPDDAGAARAERDAIARELARAVGLGGRDRPEGAAAERARQAVRQAIRSSLRRIEAVAPGLARRLEAEVRTGTFCCYEPRGDPALAVEEDGARVDVPNNLPARASSFVGRDREMAEVAALLEAARTLTLSGTGGAGKTRLATEVARAVAARFPDGVWFCDLAPLSDGSLVAPTAARALGLKEDPRVPAADAVVAHLRERRALVILDNCEHLLAAAATLAGRIVEGAPGARVLSTSREPLGTGGETVWRVPSLPAPPEPDDDADRVRRFAAARLFAERAARADASFAITRATAAAVARICRSLDGIPLAIELAAGKVAVLGPAEIAERLEDRLRLLVDGTGPAPARHRTLRAAIEWSHELLSEEERALFRRLSVFSGGFSVEAAESVCGGDDVVGTLGRLSAKSLVAKEPFGERARGRMLETVRAYAREVLRASGEAGSVATRHLEWFEGWVARAAFDGPDPARWYALAEQDHDNLRAAMRWALDAVAPERALAIAARLAPFWAARGFRREGLAWLDEALTAATPAPPGLRGAALGGAGRLAHGLGEMAVARRRFEESLEACRAVGDEQGVAKALNNIGTVAHGLGDGAEARAWYERALAAWRALGDDAGAGRALVNLAGLARGRGDVEEARAMFEEALAVRRRIGDRSGLGMVLNNYGNLALQTGDNARARVLFEEALALRRGLGERTTVGVTLHNLGLVARAEGSMGTARALFEESLSVLRDAASKQGVAETLGQLGAIACDEGEASGARDAYGEALTLWRELGVEVGVAAALSGLARATLLAGDSGGARALWGEALTLYRARGDAAGVAECERQLARLGTG